MDDLTTMLQQVLDDPESMKQIQAVAASLGLGGDAAGQGEDTQAALPQQNDPPPASVGGLDLGMLSGLVSDIAGKNQTQQNGDIHALTALLNRGRQTADSPAEPAMPFDMNMLFKLQKAMSTVGSNRANIELLMALKPRLKPQRAKKIDDAVRVMQLVQFLPLLKETGLFGDTQNGLGGLLGGLGDGVNHVLGGLFGAPGARRE